MAEDEDWSTRRALVRAVAADIKHVTSMSGQADEQFVRRSMVRTVFSLLDAFSYFLKREARIEAERHGITFSRRMTQVITEKRLRTADDGSETEVDHHVDLETNLRVAIRAYAQVRGCTAPWDIAHLPREFALWKGVRDRITHPKRAADLEISDEEARAGNPLLLWFLAVHDWFTEQELENIERVRKKTSAIFEASRRQIIDNGARAAQPRKASLP